VLFTVAIPVELLLHTPLPVISPRVVVDPTHTVAVPVIGAGVAYTVTVVVALPEPVV
jgi:hypothetical protein